MLVDRPDPRFSNLIRVLHWPLDALTHDGVQIQKQVKFKDNFLKHEIRCHSYERQKKRPTQKERNRFRPPETHVERRQGRLAQQKTIVAKTWLPSNGYSIWPTFFFPAACRTRLGGWKCPIRHKTALLTPIRFYVGVFLFPPLICYFLLPTLKIRFWSARISFACGSFGLPNCLEAKSNLYNKSNTNT